MNKYFFAEALASRPMLWKAMLRSNARPEGTAAPDALAEAASVLGDRAAPLLAWLHEKPVPASSGEVSSAFWDYAEESRRLALIGKDDLAALCWYIGTALHGPDIAHVVRRDEVLKLRAELGDALYLYAVRRGQYQLGAVRQLFAPLDSGLALAERCVLHGIMALHVAASAWPEELSAPFLAKLPELPAGTSLPHFGDNEVRAIWFALKKLFLREVAPSWAPCFD